MSCEVLELFSKPVKKLIEEKGFTTLTEPQVKAIPLIAKGENVLLIAPTGTGKTEAAFLPLLDKLIRCRDEPGIKLVYITPLRALNRDLLDRLRWWCSRLDLRISVRHGDTEAKERDKQRLAPPDILITTPETLQAILPGKVMQEHLKRVKWVIVDEVHELVGEKRGSQLAIGLERLRRIVGSDFQLIGLSATIGSPEEVAKFLFGENRKFSIVKVPVAKSMEIKIIYPEPEEIDFELAEKLATFPEVAARLRVMKQLIDQHTSSLIFTNTRSIAEVLASRFRVWDIEIPVSIHHGSLSKPSRLAAESGLKRGEIKGVVCTSSLELGIDIGSIELVIQYNSPRQVTRLIQRVGRSGHRVGGVAKGVVVTMDSDDTLEAAVIAKRALREELEPAKVQEKPLDVLNHQVAGLLLEKPNWSTEEILNLVKKAYPYKSLTKEELLKVLDYMDSRKPRLAAVFGEDVVKPRPSEGLYAYYFENLSMIPEEKQYVVVDEDTNMPIGVLDEAFISEYGEPGTKFIIRGSPWRILYIYKDAIYVKQESDPLGAVPSWVGEEIPVPYEIAQEVGKIRGQVEKWLLEGRSPEWCAKKLSEEYPLDEKTALKAIKEVVEQVDRGLPIPSDDTILIEGWRDYVIVSCAFGLLVNRTLARVLGYLLADITGAGVGIHQDPYRIYLKSDAITPQLVADILKQLSPSSVVEILKKAIEKTSMFKYRLLHVAKRFGVIAKDADYESISMPQLIESLRDTVVYEEAVRETFFEDLDVETCKKVVEEINKGKVKIFVAALDELSPLSRIGMEELGRKTDLIPPDRMKKILLESAKARLLLESVTVACLNCYDFVSTIKVKDLMSFKCPVCGSAKIGFSSEEERDVLALCEELKAQGKPSDKHKRLFKELNETASLFERYGFMAAMAYVGRGLSINDVKDILSHVKDVNQLVELVMKREQEALRRRFKVSEHQVKEAKA